MSAPQTACVAAADVSHPDWCDPEWCDTTCAAVDHLGVPTTWQTRAAEFELSLRRRDVFAEIPEQRAAEVSLWMASRATDDAGVQAYLTPAELRATARQLLVFAALAEADGAPADVTTGQSVVAAADLLGHEDATLVLRVYGHLMPGSEDRTRKAVDVTAGLVEVVVPDLDMWQPAHDHDAGCDVLHMPPDDAMDLVQQLLDRVHDVDPGLCCGELPVQAQGGARHE